MTLHDGALTERLAGLSPWAALGPALPLPPATLRLLDQSHRRLLHPADASPFTGLERRAIAAFVAALHDEAVTRKHCFALLVATAGGTGLAPVIAAEADGASRADPYGRLPTGTWPVEGLAVERLAVERLAVDDLDGPAYAAPSDRARLGPRLAAAMTAAHRIAVLGAGLDAALQQDLAQAGWTTAETVLVVDLVKLITLEARLLSAFAPSARQGQDARIAAE